LALRIRRVEQVATEAYRLGSIPGHLHPCLAEEENGVGVILALEPDEYVVNTPWGHGHTTAKGHESKLMRQSSSANPPATTRVAGA
jgi:TPP-dependent pyruvate/acetoin dehydrogenase alpha subunit